MFVIKDQQEQIPIDVWVATNAQFCTDVGGQGGVRLAPNFVFRNDWLISEENE
jgi:hypothetical protein